eukprot:2336495-Pyramimonas_sp.AAC.2
MYDYGHHIGRCTDVSACGYLIHSLKTNPKLVWACIRLASSDHGEAEHYKPRPKRYPCYEKMPLLLA